MDLNQGGVLKPLRASRVNSKANAGGRVVRLSLAVASIYPFGALGFGDALAQPYVTCLRPIMLGRFANCPSGGKIGVTPSGVQITDGCVLGLGTMKHAQCRVTVSLPQTQSLQMSVTKTQVNLTGAGTMALGSFNVNTVSGGNAYTFPSGSFQATQKVIGIGGTVTVSPSQPSGAYSGTVTLTVTFL